MTSIIKSKRVVHETEGGSTITEYELTPTAERSLAISRSTDRESTSVWGGVASIRPSVTLPIAVGCVRCGDAIYHTASELVVTQISVVCAACRQLERDRAEPTPLPRAALSRRSLWAWITGRKTW